MRLQRGILRLLALTTFLGGADRVIAQDPNVRNFDPRSGLASSECYSMIQDRHGYVWIAGDAGVSRFDGRVFRNFTTKDGLADNTVFHIHEDHSGRIWFVSYSGAINYFHNGSIYNIAANDTLRKIIQYRSEVIVSFDVDEGDTVWVSYNFKEFYLKIPPGENHRHVQVIRDCDAARNLIFVNGRRTPLYTAKPIYPPESPLRIGSAGNWKEFNPREGNLSDLPVFVMLLVSERRELFISICDVLYHISADSLVAKRVFPARIVGLNFDRDKNLWVGTYQNGAHRFLKGNISKDPHSFFGGLSVTNTLEDIEHGFWFSTLEKGIFYAASLKVAHLELPGDDQGVISLSAIGRDLFAGSSTGELHRISADPDSRPAIISSLKVEGQRTNVLMPYGENLLVNSGGRQGGLRLLTKTGRVLHRFTVNGTSVGGSAIHVMPDNSIVVCGLYEIMEFDPRFRLAGIDTMPVRINAIYLASTGIQYIGCKDGLWQKKGDSLTYLGSRFPSVGYPVQQIHADKRSRIWISTKGGGVSVIDRGRLIQVDQAGTDLSRNCTQLTEDHLGRIWVGSSEGLYMIDGDGKKIKRFGMENGLRTNEIHSVQYFNRSLFIGTPLGIEFFPLTTDLANSTPPPVLIREIRIDDQPATLSDKLADMPYDQNDIEFSFIGLTYKSSGPITYKYRLRGYDADWKLTGNDNVKYTNLSPGRYRFDVLALNNDGVPSIRPAHAEFRISLPWWHEPWAIGGASTGAALTIGLATFGLVRRVKTRQERKSRVEQLLVESRLTALRAQMNPHFIFNVINSIQHFILLNDKERAYDYLARFSRLIRMVLDNSRDTSVSLEKEIQLLTLYIELEKLRFEHDLDFRIVVRTDLSPEFLSLPNMLIQPYVENAIIHGIAPKRDKGVIEVQFIQEGKVLKAIVSDNGIGRRRSNEIRKNGWHKSAGMSITAERLKIIGEAAKSDIQVVITDLHDEKGCPAGTRVELNIPLS